MNKLIRTPAAATRYGFSRWTIMRMVHRDPEFPRPIRLNSRVVLFSPDELDAYFESKRMPRSASPSQEVSHA